MISAQIVIFLAKAIATSIRGFRAAMRASHESSGIDLRPSQLSRDIAPMISSLRISVCPAFEVRPRRSFPPEENWRGTRPSHAAKSRPQLKFSIGEAKVSTARAVNGPTQESCVSLSRENLDLAGPNIDARRLLVNLLHQVEALFAHQIGQFAACRSQNFFNAFELMNSLWDNVAVFIEACPECVDQFGALVDEAFSSAK